MDQVDRGVGERKAACDDEVCGSDGRPDAGSLSGDRREISERAEVVDADEAKDERPGIRSKDRLRALFGSHSLDCGFYFPYWSAISCSPVSMTAARWWRTRSRSFQKKNKP